MDIYREIILDHYTHPRNQGVLEKPSHQATQTNPLCGDEVHVTLDLQDGHIKDIKFNAVGCAVTIAASSLLSEKVINTDSQKILAMTIDDIIELLGTQLTLSRRQCAHVPLMALQKALKKPQ